MSISNDTVIDTWELDEPYHGLTLEEIREQLVEESGFRVSIVDRGLKRLDDVVADSSDRWILSGRPELGDTFPIYTVCLDGGFYHCTCFGHSFGESRRRRLCSHVVAVIVARRLNRVKVKPAGQRIELTPASLGLPPQFTEFRPAQLQALERIQANKRRFILLQAPTGSGKSLIVAAAQRLLRTRFLYTCHTKQLQAQFVDDFAYDLEEKEYAVELKGRANYPTLRYGHLFPKINASMCTSKKEIHCRWCCDGECNPDGITGADGRELCFAKLDCPYRVQKARVARAELAVVNTALFLNEANFVGQFNGWPWLVLDEADLIESALMNFVEVEITRRWIERLGLEPPKRKTVQEAWIEWASHVALPAVNAELLKLESEYGVEDMSRQGELERMQKKLEFFLREVSEKGKWVFLPEEERWTFKPVFISGYAEQHLWRHADRFLLMSATIISPDEMAHSLGIPRDEIDFIDLPSTFPPERRPIYYLPAANLTKKTEKLERPKAIAALDSILDRHPDDKVLVHTVSYGYAQQTFSLSRHQRRMLTYDQAKDREIKLEEFKKAPNGTVLVASSMERGVNLPGDLCRVAVVMKVPFLNLGDKQIATRLHAGKKNGQLWYNVSAIRTLVQMCGRGMRSADDRCDIYILDAQFERLYRENKYLFPAWWRAALKMPAEGGGAVT
jgi:Rad3-related DNA helicase